MNTKVLYSYLESYACYKFTFLHKYAAFFSLCMNVSRQHVHLSAFKSF
jgi:hypothetical protein